MTNINDMFNGNTLNIFTDASIKTTDIITSCAGCIVLSSFREDKIIDEDYMIIRNSTNNDGEITAILLGIAKAIKWKNDFKKINIISDSKICIHGLNIWMNEWIKRSRNGVLYSSSGKVVKNQNIFIAIMNIIAYNNLKVKFIHCKGHVNTPTALTNACRVYKETNFIKDRVDRNLIAKISHYNNIVDNNTRFFLNHRSNIVTIDNDRERLLKYSLTMDNYNKYKELIKN